MLFNSIDFSVFFPLVFIIYWFCINKNLRSQNFFLVICSYIFYGWWDYRFLALIFSSTLIDFYVGKKIANETLLNKRKSFLLVSIFFNLGMLGFFKYYNFFVDNFITAFTFFGSNIQPASLNIILPVGISFYTFQTMSYTIDIYKNKLKPTNDFIAFSAFVSFFPQLVAGPIERATNLLPQFSIHRNFDYVKSVDGCRQILWGLFKKIVIADNCAIYANQIFNNSADYSGSTLLLGALFFTFQIYGDFSGYSDIAIGISRLLGFNLMQNFNFPYFSRNIAEFWRRWHISLSSWFKDYLYIPLGGSRGNLLMKIKNTIIIFVVSGFWHGANWTFIFWGFLNALYFIPNLISGNNRKYMDIVAKGKVVPSLNDILNITKTFILTIIAWIFFRAESMQHAIEYISEIFSPSLFANPEVFPKWIFPYIVFFILIEWLGRGEKFAISNMSLISNKIFRYIFYYLLVILIICFSGNEQDFIYFQF